MPLLDRELAGPSGTPLFMFEIWKGKSNLWKFEFLYRIDYFKRKIILLHQIKKVYLLRSLCLDERYSTDIVGHLKLLGKTSAKYRFALH